MNPYILSCGKKCKSGYFAFCLSGHPELLLHDDSQVNAKWKKKFNETEEGNGKRQAQCCITGRPAEIARTHNKIKGLPKSGTGGNTLVCFNCPAESSYGYDQSYNSNISEDAMYKYTAAMNYLLANKKHKTVIDDVAVIHWASSGDNKCDDLFSMVFGDASDADATDEALCSVMKKMQEGTVTAGVLKSFAEIDPSVDFYIVGLKTNSSRIAVKFIYRRKFGDILQNIVKHQQDMQVREKGRAVSISDMEKELVFSKGRQNTLNSELLAKLFEAIICGHSYPEFLLSTVIRRIKTDSDEEKNKHIKINDTRIGIIKACINRRSRISGQKEEIKMALDKENRNPAYLCGRLFAVLEAIQQKASNYFLNRTIRDSYFASAAANPAVMFPKLIKLSQYHLSKIGDPKYFTDDVKEIVDLLGSEFPGTLTLTEQGKFIIGYYQQQKYTDERKKLIQEVKNNGNQ